MNGNYLPPNTPPPPRAPAPPDDWAPFDSPQQFELADLLFRKVQMSATNIDELLSIWGLSSGDVDSLNTPPFGTHKHLYDAVDSGTLGSAPWQCLEAGFEGDVPQNAPAWRKKKYEVWYRDPDTILRNMLDNPDFDGQFDYAPYVELDKNCNRRWSNFMSGNYAWKQAVCRTF